MNNTLTYILELQGNIDEKLKQIGIANEQQLDTWSKVQKQVNAANSTMNNMGKSVGSLTERINALRAQREWIPAGNKEAIRAINNEIKELEAEINKLNNLNGGKLSKWWGELKNSMPFKMITNPIVMATAAFSKLTRYVGDAKRAYTDLSASETRLVAVMGNTMNATREQVQSIIDITNAQEKLGVISRSVQVAGAQELSTYLTKKDSLKQLIPVMNDMLAQQYGLNASQAQAQSIATMLGKVMDGQVGALSRYGYSFTEAQEQILKTGTEAQRAAVLFDVVSASVGGVNAALAQTPEGKLAQHANDAANLQERVGKLANSISVSLVPVKNFFLSIAESIVSVFEKLNNNKGVLVIIGSSVAAMAAAWGAYTIYTKAAVIWTSILTAKQWLLNIALNANPVGLIILAIGALVAIVATAIIYYEKFGAALLLLTGPIGIVINGIMSIKRNWDSVVQAFKTDGILAGIKRIGIVLLDAILYPIQQLLNMLAKIPGLGKLAQSGTDKIADIRAKLNLQEPAQKVGTNEKLQAAVGGGSGTGGSGTGGGTGNATNEAIATGGTRNTTININGIKMIETLIMQGTISENVSEIERTLAEGLYRILGMAETSAA